MNLRKKIGTVMQIGLLIMILFAAGCGLQKQEEGARTYYFYVKIINGEKQLCDKFYIAEELETIRQMTVIKNVNGWVIPGVKDHEIKWKDDSLKYAAQRATGIDDRPIWLSDTWDITELEVHRAESFDDITELPNLEILNVRGEQIVNIEGIGKLKKPGFPFLIFLYGSLSFSPIIARYCPWNAPNNMQLPFLCHQYKILALGKDSCILFISSSFSARGVLSNVIFCK